MFSLLNLLVLSKIYKLSISINMISYFLSFLFYLFRTTFSGFKSKYAQPSFDKSTNI